MFSEAPAPGNNSGGVLARPSLPPAWSPTPRQRPEVVARGRFEFPEGKIAVPKHPPYPDLPPDLRVTPAPRPTPAIQSEPVSEPSVANGSIPPEPMPPESLEVASVDDVEPMPVASPESTDDAVDIADEL